MSVLLQFRRGPYTFLATNVILPEGVPYEAGITEPDGSTFETLWLGGHDGENKLLGGGFQTTNGMPQFSAPVGAALLDPSTCTIWVSTAYNVSGYASGSGSGSGTGTGTGTGTGSGVGQWCPISENGGGGGIKEIDTQAPILGGPITAGETGTISHAVSGVTPGSYSSVAVDEFGHVTGGNSGAATTLLYATDSTSTFSSLYTPQTVYTYSAPAGTLTRGSVLRCRAGGLIQSVQSGQGIVIALVLTDTNNNQVQLISCNQSSSIYNAGKFSIEFELSLDQSGFTPYVGTFLLDSMAPSVNAAWDESIELPSDGSFKLSLIVTPNEYVINFGMMMVWKT